MQVFLQPCYVIHRRSYRESSFLVEVFSREQGRLSIIAKGVRQARSSTPGLLQAFTPLLLSWSGKSELMTLTHVETQGEIHSLQGKCLFTGFYFNELIMRLLQKWDPHPGLYDCYHQALQALSTGLLEEKILRRFEIRLLEEVGYGLLPKNHASLHHDFLPNSYYRFIPEQGFVRSEWSENEQLNPTLFLGKNLLAIAKEEWEDVEILSEAKRLIRCVLTPLLGGTPIHSRQLFTQAGERSRDEH